MPWITPERERRWAADEFSQEAERVVEDALTRAREAAQQTIQPAVETARRAAQSFSVPSIASLTAGWVDPPDQQSQPPATNAPSTADGASSSALRNFSVPDISALTAGWTTPTQSAPPAASGTPTGLPTSSQAAASVGQGAESDEAWARQEAARLGIDPEKAVQVANTEGGFLRPARQNQQGAPAYGPYQLYIGGPDNPGLGDEALAAGIDPRNASHNRAAITFTLEHAAKHGWGAFQGAVANGIGEWDGIPRGTSAPASAPPAASQPAPAAQAEPAGQQFSAGSYTPNQISAATDAGLDYETALAVCGPAAAIAFARRTGRNPTMREAVDLARQVGWTAEAGMAGPASQRALLERMGVAAKLEEGAPDWQKVAADVQRGNPVTISTPGHYFVAERYDPQSGAFDFGNSAAVLKASGGRRWFRPDELAGLGMGEARATLYIDNPESPTPSAVAGSSAPQAAWSPDEPAGPAVASQAPVGRSGGGGVMYRAPLANQPELPPDASPVMPTFQGDASDDGPAPEVQPYPEEYGPINPPTAPESPLKPVWDAAGRVVGYVQHAGGEIIERIVEPKPIVGQTEADRRLLESARSVTGPVNAAAASAARTVEQAAGAPEGSVLQAAQDVSGVLGPNQPVRAVQTAVRAARSAAVPEIETGLRGVMRPPSTSGVSGVVDDVLEAQRPRALPEPPPRLALPEPAPRVSTGQGMFAGADTEIAAAARARDVETARQRWMQGLPPRDANEQLIVEEYGRRWESLMPHEQGFRTRQMVREAAEPRERVSRADLLESTPQQPYRPEINLNARMGATASSSILGDISNAILGATGGAVYGQAMYPDDPEAQRNAIIAGAIGAPMVGRLAPRSGGALATAGFSPNGPRRGNLPRGAQTIRASEAAEVGRLRLDKFPEELRPHIQAAAREAGFYAREQRRGVLGDEAVQGLADDIGRTVDDWIQGSRAGKSYNAEEAAALRNLVTGQASKVNDLAQELADAQKSGLVTDLLITRVHHEGERLAALVNVMEGARAEAGRGLRAWRVEARPTDPADAAQRIFNKFGGGPEGRQRAIDAVQEFNQLVQDGADPIQLSQFWARVERGGTIRLPEILTAIRYNSMLSSPRTWEIGWVGSILQAPLKIGNDLLAALVRPGSGEIGEAALGSLVGLKRGLRPMWETIYHGITTEQAMGGQLPRGLAARTTSETGKMLGTLVDLPGRMVAAPDALFTQVFRQAELGRQAAIEAYRKGLKGEARAAFIRDFLDSPPKVIDEQVTRSVDKLMLRGDTGHLGQMFESFGRGVAGADLTKSFILPFMKVAYHIWDQGVELTPAGAVGTLVDVGRGSAAQLLGREGLGWGPYARGFGVEDAATSARPLAERLRYNAMGLAITGWATMNALEGRISGAGPDDVEKRRMLQADGWQPYSIKIGDTWVSYGNWGPVAVPLASAAAYAESGQYAKPGATAEQQLSDMVGRTAKLVTEQTFIKGIGDLVKAFEDVDRYGPQVVANMATSMVPYGAGLNTVGQAFDPVRRQPERAKDVGFSSYIVQSIESRLPFIREQVPAAQDSLGRPSPNEQQGLTAFQPFRFSQEKQDATLRTFLDAGVDIGQPKSQLTVARTPIELTPAEQRRWNELRGAILVGYTPRMTGSEGYQKADRLGREQGLRKVLSLASEAADRQLMEEIGNDELRRRFNEAARKRAS